MVPNPPRTVNESTRAGWMLRQAFASGRNVAVPGSKTKHPSQHGIRDRGLKAGLTKATRLKWN